MKTVDWYTTSRTVIVEIVVIVEHPFRVLPQPILAVALSEVISIF